MKPADIVSQFREAKLLAQGTAAVSLEAEKAEGMKPDHWMSPAQVLEATAALGAGIPTGIAEIDMRLRGGLRRKKLVTVGAPPGCGKSTLTAQIASRMAATGASVVMYCPDEGREAAAVRVAQHYGITREDAETQGAEAIARLAALDGSLSLYLPNPELAATIEEAVADVVAMELRPPVVVVFDSIQRMMLMPERGEQGFKTVEKTMYRLRRLAEQHDFAALLVSEIGQEGYRARKESDQSSDLAGWGGGRSVAHASDVLLRLRKISPEGDDIKITPAKNRFGMGGGMSSFAMRFDRTTALYSLLDESAIAATEDDKKVTDAAGRVLALLEKHSGLSTRQIRAAIPIKSQVLDAAMRRLGDNELIAASRGAHGAMSWGLVKGA